MTQIYLVLFGWLDRKFSGVFGTITHRPVTPPWPVHINLTCVYVLGNGVYMYTNIIALKGAFSFNGNADHQMAIPVSENQSQSWSK